MILISNRISRVIDKQVTDTHRMTPTSSLWGKTMLSYEENSLLTETNAGTTVGEYFRRYWLPAMLSTELPVPDGEPVGVRLLGENLIAFRDSNGRVGSLDKFCAHRRASLLWRRNEDCGLRCVYHGWKFDVDGAWVDMPNEPPEYAFENKVRTTAYPTREYVGLIWAYMGPPERVPDLPKLEWACVPETHRYISKRFQQTNYLQAVKAGIDSGHSNFLHASIDAFRRTPAYLEEVKKSTNLRAKYHLRDSAPQFTVRKCRQCWLGKFPSLHNRKEGNPLPVTIRTPPILQRALDED